MRIITGNLKGRVFDSPRGHRTHPMSDKIRGALFGILGDIEGLSLLDAFAGSGAIAFEAISRGAATAVAIESDRTAQQAITENIHTLGVESEVKLIKATVNAWLATTRDQFDIVVLDPPYDNLQPKLLVRLAERAEAGGTIVLSLPPTASTPLSACCQLLVTKAYGDATLIFYRRKVETTTRNRAM